MTTFTYLTVGDKIGVLMHGTRKIIAYEATVTKITPTRLATIHNGLSEIYDKATGWSVGRRSKSELVAFDDPQYKQLMAEQNAAAQNANAQRLIEKNERETRFGIAAIAGDDEKLAKALHSLASEVVSLERAIRRRLDRVTPENLYREMKWLEDSAAQSATLNWLTGVLSGLVRDGSTPRDQLVAFRDHARSALLTPSSCLSQLEDRAQLLAAREVYEKLDGLLRWKLS